MDRSPFRVRVYDKAFAFLFPLGDCAVSVTMRELAKGTGTITVAQDHPRIAALLTEGTRVTVDYFVGDDYTDDTADLAPGSGVNWLRVMSGPLWTVTGGSTDPQTPNPVFAFGIEDDFRIVGQILGWANPGAAIGSQTANAYDARTGHVETLIKGYVGDNATRLGLPLTMATDLARGASVKANVRFDNLADALTPLAAAAGLGIRVAQVGSGLVLDVFAGTDRTARTLSVASGTILTWQLVRTGPTATRAIVAAQGTGTARAFSQVTDSATETLWGTKVEAFIDARDTADATLLAQRGSDAILAGAPQAGYAVTVGETDVVRYGRNLFIGDLVSVEITPDLTIVDRLTECTITSGDNGLEVIPQVGQSTAAASPNGVFARAISQALQGVRQLRTRV